MYEIEVVSGEFEDYEVWTCKNCGRTVTVNRGGDVACCPCEFEDEHHDSEHEEQEKAREEAMNDYYDRQSQQVSGYDVPRDEF